MNGYMGNQIVASTRSNATIWVISALVGLALLFTWEKVHADEGGIQSYVPGAYGNLGMAKFPGEGFYFLDLPIFNFGTTPVAHKGGDVYLKIEDTVIANAFVGAYISNWKFLGGDYFGALAVPILWYEFNGVLESSNLPVGVHTDPISSFGLSDLYVIPFGFIWRGNPFSFVFYEGINVPVGKYELGSPSNIGLNHWAFDSNLSITYKPKGGKWEVDANFGYIFNTTNTATDYKSGNNFHVDYTVGYGVSERISVGISGYVYQQTTGDSGTGATLGDFKGEGNGIGPSASFLINEKKPLALQIEWIHDIHTENRLTGDWVILTLFMGFH